MLNKICDRLEHEYIERLNCFLFTLTGCELELQGICQSVSIYLGASRSHKCYNLVKRPYSELMEILVTLVLGSVLLVWGMQFGRVLVRSSVTANDLFKGRNAIALLFLGFYIGLLLLALNLPQMPALPIDWTGNKQGNVGAGFTNHKCQKLLTSKTRPSSLS